jgi:glutamine synthetase
MLTLSDLHSLVAAGQVDTVIVAFADMQGRLTGKRVSARLFVEDVAAHGAECCNYLLAVDVDMNTVDGYAISSWETGYGDMVMTPDFGTLRLLPWLSGTALVMADLSFTAASGPARAAHHPARPAGPPRRGRPARLRRHRAGVHGLRRHLSGRVAGGYRNLTPATDYNVDYAMLASTRMEPLLRDIRLGMDGAGMYCEGVKGECNLGQQEIAFRYDEAWSPVTTTPSTRTAPRRSPISTEVADLHGEIR